MEELAAKPREKEEKGSANGATGRRRLLAYEGEQKWWSTAVEKGGDGGRLG